MATAEEYAAAAWGHVLTASNGVRAPAGVFLTDTYLNASTTKEEAAVLKGQLETLIARVDALALVAGDPEAILAAVRAAMTEVVDSTVLEVRPPA